jgi:hypothetical protein
MVLTTFLCPFLRAPSPRSRRRPRLQRRARTIARRRWVQQGIGNSEWWGQNPPPPDPANRRGRGRRVVGAIGSDGGGRPGGGLEARPSAAMSRPHRTARGSFTAPTISREPAQRASAEGTARSPPRPAPAPHRAVSARPPTRRGTGQRSTSRRTSASLRTVDRHGQERNAVVHRDGAGGEDPSRPVNTSSDTDQTSVMATNRGNKRMSGSVDDAETRVRTVVAPTGFEPVFQP